MGAAEVARTHITKLTRAVNHLAGLHSSPSHARGGMLFEAWVTYTLIQLDRKVNALLEGDDEIIKREKAIMADVKIAQETLDADGDTLTALAGTLQELIDSGELSDANQDKLNAGIAALSALGTPVVVTPPTPVEPTDGS